MAKTTLFKGVVYLSDDNYAKLIADGVIEVGGQTITYDESMVYVTPKALGGDYYTKSEVEEKLKTVFDNVTYLDNSYGEQSVLYDTDDGITIMQTTRVVSGDKTNDISSELTIPLVGSEEIVFDATEDGSHIQAHLDMDITNKLARTLVTPVSTPTATEIVAVDTTNSQTMLAIGDGLSIENGTLKASSDSGNKLYLHKINSFYNISGAGAYILSFTIINNNSTLFTYDTIKQYLTDVGATNIFNPYPATGYYNKDVENENIIITGIHHQYGGLQITGARRYESNGVVSITYNSSQEILSSRTITDTVIEL